MKARKVFWLRVSYWSGAVVDAIAALVMLHPGLFALLYRPLAFQPDVEYRFAMGMGAPLMLAWTVLLIWADRKPLERKGILPITLLVVAGEAAVTAWGIAIGFLPLGASLSTFGMQAALSGLFLFSYLNARGV